jgi:hypothetical protein
MKKTLKRTPYRNRKLLNLAHDVQHCQFQLAGCTGFSVEGCEPAHSNFAKHGKALRQKSDDDQHVASCSNCHRLFDGNYRDKLELEEIFYHARQRTFNYYKLQGWLGKVGYNQRVEFQRTGELI